MPPNSEFSPTIPESWTFPEEFTAINDPVKYEDTIKNLEHWIEQQGKHEKKCHYWLSTIPEALHLEKAGYNRKVETRLMCGNSDLIVAFSKRDEDTHSIVNEAFLWELKAPNCKPFEIEKENKNRAKPTTVLLKAEQEILHYFHEIKENSTYLKNTFGVTPEHFHFGGIIIGRKLQETDSNYSLTKTAIEIRRNYFYQSLSEKICLWNWDLVLEKTKIHLKQLQSQHQSPTTIGAIDTLLPHASGYYISP